MSDPEMTLRACAHLLVHAPEKPSAGVSYCVLRAGAVVRSLDLHDLGQARRRRGEARAEAPVIHAGRHALVPAAGDEQEPEAAGTDGRRDRGEVAGCEIL